VHIHTFRECKALLLSISPAGQAAPEISHKGKVIAQIVTHENHPYIVTPPIEMTIALSEMIYGL
jgi:hypothetical protein